MMQNVDMQVGIPKIIGNIATILFIFTGLATKYIAYIISMYKYKCVLKLKIDYKYLSSI